MPVTEPTDKIEITPQMIEAGMHEYSTRWIGLRDADDEIAKEMLAAAYRAMFRLRPWIFSDHLHMNALNGRVQVSSPAGNATIGLIVERGTLYGGVLLSPSQAQKLARFLLNGVRVHDRLATRTKDGGGQR